MEFLLEHMTTKEDHKNVDLKTILTILFQNGDAKFLALIAELLKCKVLDKNAARRILAMEPFPKSV